MTSVCKNASDPADCLALSDDSPYCNCKNIYCAKYLNASTEIGMTYARGNHFERLMLGLPTQNINLYEELKLFSEAHANYMATAWSNLLKENGLYRHQKYRSVSCPTYLPSMQEEDRVDDDSSTPEDEWVFEGDDVIERDDVFE